MHWCGRQQAGALVIVEQQGGREQVSRCNAAAQAYGIRTGLMLPAALALCAGLSVQVREHAREQQALHELASWAYQFSARISFEPSLLLLEVGASLRLFGGLSALMAPLLRELGQMGYTAQYAVAPTPTAAALLARNRPATEVLDRQQIDAAVHDLPLACLTRDQQVRDLIRQSAMPSICRARS